MNSKDERELKNEFVNECLPALMWFDRRNNPRFDTVFWRFPSDRKCEPTTGSDRIPANGNELVLDGNPSAGPL